MKKIFIFLLISSSLSAQYQYTKTQRNLDFALAFGSAVSPSLSYQKLYGIGKSDRFKIGWGVRFNTFFSGQKDFITAPAKLTSGKESIVALFTENIVGNLDTLQLTNSAIGSLNGKVVLQYSFRKLDLGFNIDALGFTFGGKQSGKFIANESKSLNNTTQTAKPTAFNLLLISDSDIGSLNSELYARYWINDRFAVRVGASFQFIEYKTDKNLTFENDRFRHKALLPFVAITYSPFKMLYKDAR
ncbi:MAG: hypothetical protein MUF45_09525 [Spirosomaceae bacterium]|nr:hypothetical protein [Spirosomataceae bacterium]